MDACPSPRATPKPLALSQIAANPRNYDGKYVSVIGYYCSGWEESGLYPKPNCDHPRSDGVWLSGAENFRGVAASKVRVTGKVKSAFKGHLGQWSAAICVSDITLIE